MQSSMNGIASRVVGAVIGLWLGLLATPGRPYEETRHEAQEIVGLGGRR